MCQMRGAGCEVRGTKFEVRGTRHKIQDTWYVVRGTLVWYVGCKYGINVHNVGARWVRTPLP
jgi:hypothetical protein